MISLAENGTSVFRTVPCFSTDFGLVELKEKKWMDRNCGIENTATIVVPAKSVSISL
jgi:hypothetical protein